MIPKMIQSTHNIMNPEALEQNGEAATHEEMERYEAWIASHPIREIAPEDRRNCEGEMAEFKELIKAFHAEFSIDELTAITHMSAEEADSHPVWQPAKRALGPIEAKLRALAAETDISAGDLAILQAEYKKASQAVGMRITSSGTIIHDR